MGVQLVSLKNVPEIAKKKKKKNNAIVTTKLSGTVTEPK